MEKAKVLTKSLTTIWQFTSVWIYPTGRTSSKNCHDWTEQIFSIDQRINDFFPLCLPFCNSFKRTKHVWFFLLITRWNHVALLTRLHIISQGAKSYGLLSQFFGYFRVFFLKLSFALHRSVLFHVLTQAPTRFISRHSSILSSLLSSPDLVALSRYSSPLFWLLILALCRSLSRSASDKLYHKRYVKRFRLFVDVTNTNEFFFLDKSRREKNWNSLVPLWSLPRDALPHTPEAV